MRGDWAAALGHVERALRVNAVNLKARNLRVLVLRKVGGEKRGGGGVERGGGVFEEDAGARSDGLVGA